MVFESPSKPEVESNEAELDDSFLDISNIDEKALEELHFDIKGLANGAPVTSVLGDFKIGGESAGGILIQGGGRESSG